MSPDKNNLNPEAAPQEGVLARLGNIPGVKQAAAILALSGGIAKEANATATIEPLPEPLNSIVNDGVNHTVKLSENDCGDVVFHKADPNLESSTWYVLEHGSTQPAPIEGMYYHLHADSNCNFVGVDPETESVWRVSRSNEGTWERSSAPVLEHSVTGDRFGAGDIAWNKVTDSLQAYTYSNPSPFGTSPVKDAFGQGIIYPSGPSMHPGVGDFDPSWHGTDTAEGRYIHDENDHNTGITRIYSKSADDLSGPSTFIAEGIAPSLSADGTKVYFGSLNPSTGRYEVKQAVLPAKATYYCDSDGDGHGDPAHPFVDDAGKSSFTYQGISYVANDDDCNDGDVHLNIAPRDCNEPTDDTDTTDTQDTTDTPETDTPDHQNPDTDTPEDEGDTGCDNTGGAGNLGATAAALTLLAARRRKSGEEESAQ